MAAESNYEYNGNGVGDVYPTVTGDMVKFIASTADIVGIDDEAAELVAEDVVYRLKTLIMDSLHFMEHGRRKNLLCTDFENSLKTRNLEV